MKILAIMGSPRKKGNTYKLTKNVEEEMKQLGDVEFEYLHLKDANIQPCKGCSACIQKGGEFCPLMDDRDKIEEKIMDADGVILASPVYLMQVTGLMKNLIDRMAYICHRPRFFNQKAMIISTTGGLGLKETLNYLEFVAGGWGLNFVNKLGVKTPYWQKNSHKRNSGKIHKAAKTFYQTIESEKLPNPSLNDHLRFKFMKELSKNLKEYLPADYEFYKNEENYYYDTKTNVLKKFTAGIIFKIAFYMMKKDLMEDKGNKENKNEILPNLKASGYKRD